MKKRANFVKGVLSLLTAAAFLLCPCAKAYAAGQTAAAGDGFAARSGASKSERIAEAVPLKVECTDKRLNCSDVLDGNERSYLTTNSKTAFTITSEERFENLYLKFELPCQWQITFHDDAKLNGGEEGFIHDYVPLERSVKSVKLTLPKDARFTDVYAFTDGQPPDWVQVWEEPCEKADLLVLPTHADDEHLWFGGALPYYAGELGYEVQVVYMTNHNNATIRNHERLNGLWKVGVTHYPVVGEQFLDVSETRASLEDAANIFGYERVLIFQVEMLRRFAPRVVLGHDINGEYGHGAHKLNAKTLLEALELTNDPTVFPDSVAKYGTCQVQKCYIHLWKENQIVVNWSEIRLQHFGNRTSLEMAKAGFACHQSQKISYGVDESGPYDCRRFGLAYSTVGKDTEGENDMFEHVNWPNKTVENMWDDVPEELIPSDTDMPSASSARVRSTSHKGISHDMIQLLLIGGAAIAAVALLAKCTAAIQRRIQARSGKKE